MTAATTTNASVTRASDLSAALDDAIAALTFLDAERLEGIERAVSAALDSLGGRELLEVEGFGGRTELREVMARHRLLGALLASTSLNLSVLEGLHQRNTIGEASWGR